MSAATLPLLPAVANPLTGPEFVRQSAAVVAGNRHPYVEQPSRRRTRSHRPSPEEPEQAGNLPVPAEAAAPVSEAAPSPYAELRAETMCVFKRMQKLAPTDPERERLRRAIIEDHMPYARHIASRYGGRGELSEDFAQVAYLGLVKATDNFDPDYGTGFLSYAAPTILGEIKRYFRDATWDVHVPRRMQELSGTLRNTSEALAHELRRAPTVAELAGKLCTDPKQITDGLRAAEAYTAGSLDNPVRTDGGGAAPTEFLGDEDPHFDAVVNRESLKPLLAKLDERDKRILLMRFLRGMTQAQIGVELQVSQMQISRLLTRILGELRAGLT